MFQKSSVGRQSKSTHQPLPQQKHPTVKVLWLKHITCRILAPLIVLFFSAYIIYRGRSRRRIAVTYRPLPNGTRSSACPSERAALYFMNYSKYFQNGRPQHLTSQQRLSFPRPVATTRMSRRAYLRRKYRVENNPEQRRAKICFNIKIE